MAHITFIHGMSNKPDKKTLLKIWKKALADAQIPLDLGAEGVTCEMVYWADVLYKNPILESKYESGDESVIFENTTENLLPAGRLEADDETESLWIKTMEKHLGISNGIDEPEQDDTMSAELERIPLPGPWKDAFLKNFLKDVHHYLFNTLFSPRPGETYRVQDEIRARFVSALRYGSKKGSPHIVVSHSMGTVIAYDCLKRVPECPQIDALVTIGSPLGIDEIQDKLHPEWTRKDGFPHVRVEGKWLNFYDKLDVVSRLDPKLANDFKHAGKAVVQDATQTNDGAWRHDISKYLKGREVSSGISRLLGFID